MVQLNGNDYEFRPGLSLGAIMSEYNLTNAKVDLDGCVIVVNGAAVTEPQALELALKDNDRILIIPKLDGG
jgi:sulfur carrier protein ThiS